VKITDIQCYPVWGGFRNYLFVVVDTDEGISGVGEAGITGRELAMMGVVEHLKPELVGQDANRIEYLWQKMSRGGFFPAGNIGASAMSAIDMALWDIQGKARGVPVYQLLGGLVRDRVVCYPHNQGGEVGKDGDPSKLVEDCLRTTEEGWKFVRWGLPHTGSTLEPQQSVRWTIRQFEAVRKALGDEIEICFDVHTRLDQPYAVQLCRAVEQYRPFFMEDPLRSENPQSFRTIRNQIAVPLAAGEQFCSKWEFRQLIEEELIDYARIDISIVGGLTEAKKIAGWCETHFINVAVHNPLGPVSSAACLQLNLACPNFGVQEQPRKPGTMLTDVVPVQAEWQDGYLLPPTRPGLGVEFDREAAKKHPFRNVGLPQLTRADGSVTNW
jgi:L-alanine-DL-glutamate epimerase-like enolase superfamily enzyme